MLLESETLRRLADYASEAACAAGALIQTYSAGEVAVMHKSGGDSLASQVVTEVDEKSQAMILDILNPTIAAFDLALLTEELPDDGGRHVKDYFWCIDPMDGTLPFTQGQPGYAVSIALVDRDGRSVIGVVYDPVRERLYRAVAGQGLSINGQPWTAPAPEAAAHLRFFCDCSLEGDPQRADWMTRLEALGHRMGYAHTSIEIRGGAVCNACATLENGPALYLKEPKAELGGGSFWDFAAIACIFQEAGGYARDYAGRRLDLNSASYTFFNHCGVCFATNAALAELQQQQQQQQRR